MRASDHPAAKPRQYRQPVFRADDEPDDQPASITPERLAEIAAIPDDDVDTSDIPEATEDDLAEATQITPYHLGVQREPPPEATREPIGSAPQDGSYIRAFWGDEDETGRLVRWRQGRHFNNRRWVSGGTWVPADGMIPLPAEGPTEWLKPPEEPEPDEIEEAAA